MVVALALGTVGAGGSLALLNGTALLGTTLEFSLSAQTRNPFSIDMDKEAEELWVPTTELANYGSLLDGLLPLGQGLVGHLRAVLLHDADHVPDDVERRQKR